MNRIIFFQTLLSFSTVFVSTTNYINEEYELINALISKTFTDHQCLNIFFNHETEEYDMKYLHKTNFLFLFSNYNTFDENCGYLYLRNELIDLHNLENVVFNRIPRILIIIKKKSNVSDQYQQMMKILRDKDFIIADFSKLNLNIYKQSRHFPELVNINFNSTQPYFPSIFHPQNQIDYKKRVVKVVTFHCPVFGSITDNANKQVLGDGVETRIYQEIVKKLNLRSQLVIPTDGKRWGTAYPNKTISGGILKYLYTGEADIGFCSLWIEASKFPYIVMSNYWNVLCLKFLVPKPKVVKNYWGSILKPFSFDIWIMVFFSTLITTTICDGLLYMQQLIDFTHQVKEINVTSSFITIVGMLVMAKNPNKCEKNNSTKHLYLWWSIFAMVITTLYSSSLVSHLTYPQHNPMIDTIEGLVKAGYYWGTPYEPPIKYVFDSNNTWHKKFASRFEFETGTDDRVIRILSGNYSVFVKCIGNEHFMEVQDVPDSILHNLRAARSCLNYFLLGFGFRKSLPYADAANRIITTLVESGITKYWLNRVFENQYSPTTFAKVYEYKTPPEDIELQPLTQKNLRSVFFVLFVGITVSLFTFSGELIHMKLSHSKFRA